MSLYTQWINRIKELANSTWLSDSQRAVYQSILSEWPAVPFVNIYGPAGCGKSFIARLLAKGHGYVYTGDLQDVPAGSAQVVLDDAEYSRMLRPLLRELRLGRVILMTEHRVRDPMPAAPLALTPHDVQQIVHVLNERCLIEFQRTSPTGLDISEIIRAEAIAQGGLHVAQ